MPKNLRVDIPGLHPASAGVSDEQSTLTAQHGRVVSALQCAHSGWIGSSAAALTELTSSWERASSRQGTRIRRHAGDIGVAAQLFSYLEQRHAARLRAVYEQAQQHSR
ncbi:MAG: hypothetical protein WBB07_21485 [Mycobacterium sp.]